MFWLNYYDRTKILSKLNNLFFMKGEEWNKIFKLSNIQDLIICDQNNKKFNKIFESIKDEIF